MLTLEFSKRQSKDKLHAIRGKGHIPAVFYGPKQVATPVSLREIDFKKVWKQAGESSIIVLKGEGEEHEALIQDVDVHPVSGIPRHADFYVIEKGKKLQIKVPLEFIGVSEAVKSLGGTLVKVLHELEIEAMPKDLPHHIVVDISILATLDSQVLAKDLALPAGVELITGPEEVVAAIDVTEEEPDEPAQTASISDIEVVGEKGKKEEEGEAGATAEAKTEKTEKKEEKPEKK